MAGTRVWTPEKLEQVKSMWAAGKNASEIASALGATKMSVKLCIHRHGFQKDDPGQKRKITPYTRSNAWRPERIEQLRTLWIDEQKTASQIATVMGVSRSNILGRVSLYGFKKEAPVRAPKPPKVKAVKVEAPWCEEARSLRLAGHSISQIADRIGKSEKQVSRVCVGLTCPVDHRKITGQNNLKKAHEMRKTKPKKPPAPRRYVPGVRPKMDTVQALRDRTRRRIRAAIGKADATREIPSVTLPRLRFLEDA